MSDSMWEYINMGFQDMSEDILDAYKDSPNKLVKLFGLYKNNGTVPVSEKQEIITIFRIAIQQDINMLDAVKTTTLKELHQKSLPQKQVQIHKFQCLQNWV